MKQEAHLETRRLVLRSFQSGDSDDFYDVFRQAEVNRFLQWGPRPRTRQDCDRELRRWIERDRGGGYGMLAMVPKGGNRVIGRCGLIEQQVEGRMEIELGYALDPRWWGRGLAIEAALACRDHAFGDLGLTRLVSLIRSDNHASIGVAKKVGMRLDREVEVSGIRALMFAMAATGQRLR